MAVRNEAPYIAAAITSLQRQTLRDWELVAVDDGSADATAEIMQQMAATDTRIRVLQRPAEGLVPALNAGLPLCRSAKIARMDGDDICHPRRLELQADWLDKRPQDAVVTCRVRHFPASSISANMRAYVDWLNSLDDHEAMLRDLFVEAPLVQPSVMLRREALEAAGGYRDHGWCEDYDLWLRLAQGGARFARLPQTLFFWRDHPQRLTRTSQAFSLDAFRTCRLHYLRRDYLREVRQVTLWGAGKEGKAWRRLLEQQGISVRRWIDVDPRKLGQRIHGALVEPPEALTPGCGPMLITIGVRSARALVRQRGVELGLVEGVDYVCVT